MRASPVVIRTRGVYSLHLWAALVSAVVLGSGVRVSVLHISGSLAPQAHIDGGLPDWVSAFRGNIQSAGLSPSCLVLFS